MMKRSSYQFEICLEHVFSVYTTLLQLVCMYLVSVSGVFTTDRQLALSL